MKRYYILILSLLLLTSCAGPRGNSAGIINGTRISYPEYISSLQANTIDYRNETNRPSDDNMKRQIFNQTWRNLAMRVILNDYYKKYDITATEQEVLDTLSQHVPAFISKSDVFFGNGKFDHELYLQSLKYDSPVNLSNIRQRYLEDYVPMQKLKPRIIDDDLLDKKARQTIADVISSTVDFDLLVFDPSQIDALVSEQELKSYYQQNIERYALEPIYSLTYLSIPIQLQEQDEHYTYAVADSIYEEISHGKNFEMVYEERRDHLSGLRVVDSDFVKVENVDSSILSILEPLAENSQSKLIRQDNGYFIYQKLQRTKSMIRYRTLQIPPIISPSTVNAQHANAMGALSLARSMGMKEAAIELGCRNFETGQVSLGEKWHQDALVISTIESRLMEHKKGDHFEPIYSPATGSWIVALLTENQVNRARPFTDVKQSIQAELQSSRQVQLALQKAKEWLFQNPDLVTSSSSADYQLVRFNQSGIDAKYKEHSLAIPFLNSMLSMQNKEKAQVESLGNTSIILIPRKIHSSNGKQVEQQTIRSYFVQTLSPNWFETWMEDKLNQAKIQIYVTP